MRSPNYPARPSPTWVAREPSCLRGWTSRSRPAGARHRLLGTTDHQISTRRLRSSDCSKSSSRRISAGVRSRISPRRSLTPDALCSELDRTQDCKLKFKGGRAVGHRQRRYECRSHKGSLREQGGSRPGRSLQAPARHWNAAGGDQIVITILRRGCHLGANDDEAVRLTTGFRAYHHLRRQAGCHSNARLADTTVGPVFADDLCIRRADEDHRSRAPFDEAQAPPRKTLCEEKAGTKVDVQRPIVAFRLKVEDIPALQCCSELTLALLTRQVARRALPQSGPATHRFPISENIVSIIPVGSRNWLLLQILGTHVGDGEIGLTERVGDCTTDSTPCARNDRHVLIGRVLPPAPPAHETATTNRTSELTCERLN